MRYYLTHIRMTIVKKAKDKHSQDGEDREPLCTMGGNVN